MGIKTLLGPSLHLSNYATMYPGHLFGITDVDRYTLGMTKRSHVAFIWGNEAGMAVTLFEKYNDFDIKPCLKFKGKRCPYP